jgi:hypothetical protein
MVNINDFIEILKLSDAELFQYLKENNKNAIVGESYILYFKDKKFPTMVAHIDTVHKEPPRNILWNNRYIWSPEGIGGDDRCGVYSLLQFQHLSVNLLFTDKEETGAIGATEACECELLNDTPYFIELDRRGNDAVFYNDELLSRDKKVRKFVRCIKKYFPIGVGAFSDISILGEYFQVASVNLGIGFHREHTFGEYINLKEMKYTISVVPELISLIDKEIKGKIKHKGNRWHRTWGYSHRCYECTVWDCEHCKYRNSLYY